MDMNYELVILARLVILRFCTAWLSYSRTSRLFRCSVKRLQQLRDVTKLGVDWRIFKLYHWTISDVCDEHATAVL